MTAIVKATRKTRDDSIVQEAVLSCEPKKFFTPGRNVESTKQKLRDARPHFRVRKVANKVAASVIVLGGVPASWLVGGLLMDNGGLLELTAGFAVLMLGTLGFPSLGLATVLHSDEVTVDMAGNELERLNLKVFNKWIHGRYGVNVMYNHSSYPNNTIRSDIRKAVSYGIKDASASIDFRGTDSNWYVLSGDENGNLFVRRRNEGELETVFDRSSPVPMKPSVAAILPPVPPQAMSETDSLLVQVKGLAGKLSGFELTVEQKHVLDRSVTEAVEAVELLAKMRVLRAEASDADAIHVLNGCLKDMESVSDAVYSMLADEAAVSTTVVSARERSVALLR